MSGEITLADALEQVESSSLTGRAKGLANLKHVLRNNSKFDTLSDDSFHSIYEALFHVAVSEVSTYRKTKTGTTRTAAENRLSACSSALRLAVEVAVRIVKLKTIRSVLDHIADTLIQSEGKFCEPLALDYAKCFRAVLSYQPHVEHLSKEKREHFTSFCLECIKVAEDEMEEDDAAPGAEFLSTAGTINGISYRSSRSHFKDSSGSQGGRSISKQIAEEMVGCLSLLAAAPNAASGTVSGDLLWRLIEFLKKSTFSAISHQEAFAAINHILAWTRTEDIELTRQATSPLVRLIRTYWSLKSASALRDEMLVMLIYLRPYFTATMQREESVTLRSELSGVLEVMRNEYSRRSEKDQFRQEDLRLEFNESASDPSKTISTSLFRLRPAGQRAEANWSTLSMLASLCHLLSNAETNLSSDDEDEDIDHRPRKRPRLLDESEETLKQSTNGTPGSRACSLQTLTFLSQEKVVSAKQLEKIVERLSISCSEENSAISAWAFLALAGFACQVASTDRSQSNRWASVWQLATRAMSNASTCRSACHLIQIMIQLKLVPLQSMSELVHTLSTAMDLNGPSTLSDSVLHLLTRVVRLAHQTNPTSSSTTAESILSWLFRIYSPSRFDDKSYASQQINFEPADVADLVLCCLGRPNHYPSGIQYPTWDTIGHVWLNCADQHDLVAYLLLLPDPPAFIRTELSNQNTTKGHLQPHVQCEATVLNSLTNELHRAQQSWEQITQDRPLGISNDAFAFLCSACCVATSVAFCGGFRDERRQKQLQNRVNDLLKALATFIPNRYCGQEKVDVMLKIFSSACSGLPDVSLTSPSECENLLCRTIFTSIQSRNNAMNHNGPEDYDDAMELDDAYDSQDSRRGNQGTTAQDLKNDSSVNYSLFSLRSSVTMYAAIIQKKHEQSKQGSSASISTSVTDYMLSFSDSSIIASRHIISGLPVMGIHLGGDDAYNILERCEKILRTYSYERSEVATGATLDILSSLVQAWTSHDNQSLYELGEDMYLWYTTTALTGGVLSPNVQKRVATLLLQLCHVNVDYGQGQGNGVESVRTNLFKLVQLGSITVQFHLAHRISTIFGLYVLSNHPAMFIDLQESLPADTEWIEGMAIRLLFLARLASAWHSLLRQCVYYMFETAGRVPLSTGHARRSIAELSWSLHFQSPQRLFNLFASQLLHTWLEHHKVKGLPFEVFQYSSLGDLIADNRDEITAQLLIRGDDEGMQILIEALESTSKDLVVHSFAKCAAYSMCWDISHQSKSANDDNSESRLRKLVGGKDAFKQLATDNFATIIGHFYLSSAQDDMEDKWLEKKDAYKSAARALAEIKNLSSSDRTLPASQQPSFKSKQLCDQIERLCRRTGTDPADPWNDSSFTIAARMLVDSIADALGPLHTCFVIRKLRLLISMAGTVSFSGFPLEMVIQTLRPFLNDSQCADDTIGVLQYLLHRGQQYLRTNLSFLYGTATLIILQMRKHSAGRQESTTQESQHQTTVHKMQNFQAWLVKYLQACRPQGDKTKSETLARALAVINLPGNAKKGSAESALLLLLLDVTPKHSIGLATSDKNEALRILSENFQAPSSIDEDCLEADRDCENLAPSIWQALRIPSLSDSFITWAAGAIGRAYAYGGQRPSSSKEAAYLKEELEVKYEGVSRSQAAIARKLCTLILSRDRFEATVADYSLRRILFSFRDAEEGLAFEQMLTSTIVPVVDGGTCGYEPTPAKKAASELAHGQSIQRLLEPDPATTLETWIQGLSVALCQNATDVAVLPALDTALQHSSALALDVFPSIVHILLTKDLEKGEALRAQLSAAVQAYFAHNNDALVPKQRYLMQLLLYLRSQERPGENTHADRLRWLDIDWLSAAQAANRCQVPATALLFAESISQPTTGGRRASSRATLSQIGVDDIPQDLLMSIFKTVEEPDSFYGVQQEASLGSVLDRLDYEADGYRSLMFRSAQTDTELRRKHHLTGLDGAGMVRSLSMLNLHSLTFALLSGGIGTVNAPEELLNSARRLQQWDIMPPEATSRAASSGFTALQELSRATDRSSMEPKLRSIVLDHTKPFITSQQRDRPSHAWFSMLASLAEMSELLSKPGQQPVRSTWSRMVSRQSWMQLAPYENFRGILSGRCAAFGVLAENNSVSKGMAAGVKESRLVEIESLLSTSRLARQHNQLQEALGATTQITDLLNERNSAGLKADVAAKSETASVLWASGEVSASVKMLRDALEVTEFDKQDVKTGRSGLLAQLAHQLAEARLEKPDDILAQYLKPAIFHLGKCNEGEEAGKVFHEFASFCDKQLQNPGNIEDFSRITKLRQRKMEEVDELKRMHKSAKNTGNEKAVEKNLRQAQSWFSLDDADYNRLKQSRDTFMQQSLQNYLLALRASDAYDISVLRFFALWLENSDVEAANNIVSENLLGVPSWKFVVLMNQLMSRLERENSTFQTSLKSLATKICSEHPHHSLHHLFATTRKPSSKDPAAMSRYQVGTEIRQHIQSDPKKTDLLKNVFAANNCYNRVAMDKAENAKSSSISINDLPTAAEMVAKVPHHRVPPPTIHVNLRRDGDYSDVPVVVRFRPHIRLMSGLSRPKKISLVASDGQYFALLLKGGEDDLRQDAIMEQVFEEASKMLKNHKTTRQRNLNVRTYKVIPLSPRSGIIEFVPNSTSFSDFLVQAHERYHPQDMKNSTARSNIAQAQGHSHDTRVKTFKKVCDHMQPVMRHFFFERFTDPDEWFEKRTAYTRTTAAISILGHVLGLGDRHCQNIMLDEESGEVVHIDLGVAFEAGKVLPVPELVPFRLTRDVVDGMGITKTEGVFRRCCELTMDALREDKDSIMTLLNVLRYDPLYTWTVSPLRAKRMQQQETGRNAGDKDVPEGSRRKEQEAGEADRALSIVEKKLSQTLSTSATVNELIQQATDINNLATLFNGWSAFF